MRCLNLQTMLLAVLHARPATRYLPVPCVLLLLFCRLIIMSFDWVGPDLVFGGMTTLFVITGILSLRDAAAGQCTLLSAHCMWSSAVSASTASAVPSVLHVPLPFGPLDSPKLCY